MRSGLSFLIVTCPSFPLFSLLVVYIQVVEHEAATGNPEALSEIRKEVMHLRVRSEALEADVRQKDKEIESLNQRLEDQANLYSSSVKSEDKLKVSEAES